MFSQRTSIVSSVPSSILNCIYWMVNKSEMLDTTKHTNCDLHWLLSINWDHGWAIGVPRLSWACDSSGQTRFCFLLVIFPFQNWCFVQLLNKTQGDFANALCRQVNAYNLCTHIIMLWAHNQATHLAQCELFQALMHFKWTTDFLRIIPWFISLHHCLIGTIVAIHFYVFVMGCSSGFLWWLFACQIRHHSN